MSIAWQLFLLVLKRRLAYRGDLLVAMLDELLRGGLALVLLQVYVAKSGAIGGWTGDQLLFILGFSLVPIALFHCFCGNLYQLSSHYIIQGNLDRVLLRPYPSFWQICLDRIAIEDLGGAVLGVAIMVVAASRMPELHITVPWLLMLVVMLLSAFGVVVAVFMAFAATGFWFEDRVGMVPPVYNLMEFGRWPDGIYAPALKFVVTMVIPFGFAAFLPASVMLGASDMRGWCTPLVASGALLLAGWWWRIGLRRYHSAGS